MAHKFTISRVGSDSAVRDAAGAVYGRIPPHAAGWATADRLANRKSTPGTLTDEARIYLNSIGMAHRYR